MNSRPKTLHNFGLFFGVFPRFLDSILTTKSNPVIVMASRNGYLCDFGRFSHIAFCLYQASCVLSLVFQILAELIKNCIYGKN